MGTNDWLYSEIVDGLTKLASLSLDYAPAFDVLPITAATWHEALSNGREWRMQRDLLRVREAFSTLALNSQQFPKPRHLLEALPHDPMALTGPKEAPYDPPELREAMRKCGTRLDPEKASKLVRRYIATTEMPAPAGHGVIDHERAEHLRKVEAELHAHYHPAKEPEHDEG